jgi:small basic protein
MPVEHAIIGALQQELCSRESHLAKIILIVVSNFIVSPIQYTVHLSVMAIIAGARTHHQIRATVKAGLRPVMMISWVTSPICLTFAWYFLPAQLWVHFFDIIAFIIGTYIDSKVKRMRLAALRRRYFVDRIEKPLPAAEAK